MVFFLAFVKLYFISLLQGLLTISRVEFDNADVLLKVSFLVGLLVVGNIIDNISTPKYLSIGL